MKEDIPFPAESIRKMQSDIVELSGVLGFLLKLEYGQPISITIDGATSKINYDPNNSEQYDRVYNAVSGNYIKNMQYISRSIFELSQGRKPQEEEVVIKAEA